MSTTIDGSQFWNYRLHDVEPSAARQQLGRRVRMVRQQRLGLTLAEFGRQVALQSGRRRSFSNVTVANWESGRQEPNFASLCAIADLARLPLVYFAGAGELDEFPRIDWFLGLDHANDQRLRRLAGELQTLDGTQVKLVFATMRGLVEGLHEVQSNGVAAGQG